MSDTRPLPFSRDELEQVRAHRLSAPCLGPEREDTGDTASDLCALVDRYRGLVDRLIATLDAPGSSDVYVQPATDHADAPTPWRQERNLGVVYDAAGKPVSFHRHAPLIVRAVNAHSKEDAQP